MTSSEIQPESLSISQLRRFWFHHGSTPMTYSGLFDGTPCGAKQAHINLHFVWIFSYSCLWHGDSSWCAWAPQISQCHAWRAAAASGPGRARSGLARPSRPRTSPMAPPVTPLHTGVVKYSMNTFSSPQQISSDTFSVSPQWWWNSWACCTKPEEAVDLIICPHNHVTKTGHYTTKEASMWLSTVTRV